MHQTGQPLFQALKIADLFGRLVHAHGRHQGTARALSKSGALLGAGVIGQFCGGKDQQQALALGLLAGRQQQIVKT